MLIAEMCMKTVCPDGKALSRTQWTNDGDIGAGQSSDEHATLA